MKATFGLKISEIGLFVMAIAVSGVLAADIDSQTRFDRQRYIDIDQIESGMRGYGLTVFQGTKPERFEVVVVSVIRNTNQTGPKRGAILIRCKDKRFDLAKGVQGVSGSPVFFDGRMAGAMAFGWKNGEEPLYGVTPIREMLEVGHTGEVGERGTEGAAKFSFDPSLYRGLMRDVLLEPDQTQKLVRQWSPIRGHVRDGEVSTGLTALPLALTVSGINEQTAERLRKWIPSLSANMATTSADIADKWAGKIKIEPGGTLTIPQIVGDFNFAVLGTVTEVVGDRVYAFGHSWNANGATSWPMGTGYVHTFVNLKTMSFKLGQMVEVVGTIQADEAAAVYGRVGTKPPMVPADIEVEWPYLDRLENFEVKIAQNQRSDPFLATVAGINAILYRGGLPWDHTIRYQVEMRFEEIPPLSFSNISSQSDVFDIIDDLMGPLGLILNNPWKEITLTGMEMKAAISDKACVARIKSAQLNQRIFQPGQTVIAALVLQPLRRPTFGVRVRLPLPSDLPPGKYKINLGSYLNYRNTLQDAQPHRYIAYDADDIRRILQERLSLSRNGLYMTMSLPQKGLAIERNELPYLPASRSMLLNDKSRKADVTQFRPLLSNKIDTDYVIVGKQLFDIEVRQEY
ncbi:MAG: hypothetical protein KAJ46_05780 [Sedimentisphaerales bacterium]|nr:hypothetical protein [Sedimentisphaerales bacterium]